MSGLSFRLLGIPVRVEVAFLLAMGFLGWSMGRQGLLLVVWLAISASSVLVHELGHAVAFRRFGARPEVVLHGFGGYTTGTAQPPARSIAVSLAGPGVGVAVGVLVLVLARALSEEVAVPVFGNVGLLRTALSDMVFVNLGWGLFNLLPMLPLDGGNVVAAALERVQGPAGERSARLVSIATAGVVGVAAVALRQPFIAVLAGYLAFQNVSALGAARDEPQMRQLDHARRLSMAGEHEAALAAAAEVAAGTRSLAVASAAAEVQAWALLALGRAEDAENVLARAGGGVGVGQLARAAVTLACSLRSGGDPDTVRLAPAFATADDPLAVSVATGLVVEAGQLERLLADLAALPPAQAVRGLDLLAAGLAAAGHQQEAERALALRPATAPGRPA